MNFQFSIFNFQFILACLYFFLPAYFTNMTPPLMRRADLFNFLDKRVDFDRKFLGEPIFGSHKSWRGVIFGILVGVLVALAQFYFYQFPAIKKISLLDYDKINILFFGFLISTGAIFGDLIFAFLKRRLRKKPGQRFLPFDQTNYVIGSALFLMPYLLTRPPPIYDWWGIWLTIFVLTFFLHIIVNWIGYLLGLHKAKW